MSLGYTDIWDYADGHPRMEPAAIGRAMTAGMTKAQLREFAASYVAEEAGRRRRAQARPAETRAAYEAEQQERQRDAEAEQQELSRLRAGWWQERKEWLRGQQAPDIREWAGQNGRPAPEHGQIPEKTRRAYAEAHGLGYVPIPSVREQQKYQEQFTSQFQRSLAKSGGRAPGTFPRQSGGTSRTSRSANPDVRAPRQPEG
jgi:hypothetical protein